MPESSPPPSGPTSGPFAVLQQAGALWAKQPQRRKTLAIAIVVLVLGGVAYGTLVHHGETWVPLAEGASPGETSDIYALLQARDVPSRLRDGKLEVLSDRATEARAIAAGAGLQHGGTGMEIFDAPSLGISSFAEQVNYRRGLEGELARSIGGLSSVERARVHLSLGTRSVFKDQEQPPTASVQLRLRPGHILTPDQVRGIRLLVAGSVGGLKPDAVGVVDQRGAPYETGDVSVAEHKLDVERNLTTRVRSMLERVVGAGKVAVVATADIDDHHTNETEEIFDKDRAVVRSESRTAEGPNATAGIGGIAGAQGNLPGAPGASAQGGGSGAGKLAETKNYEITRTVRQTQGPSEIVKKLHVAVVVDYKSEGGKAIKRTDAEVAELTALARQAAGIDDARGDTIELRAIAFAPEVENDALPPVVPDWTQQLPLPLPILAAAAGGVLLLVLGAFAVVVMKRRRRARRDADHVPLALPAPLLDIERVLDAKDAHGLPAPALEPALPAGPPVEERVLAAVRADVERAAAVLTTWLAEPPPKGAKP